MRRKSPWTARHAPCMLSNPSAGIHADSHRACQRGQGARRAGTAFPGRLRSSSVAPFQTLTVLVRGGQLQLSLKLRLFPARPGAAQGHPRPPRRGLETGLQHNAAIMRNVAARRRQAGLYLLRCGAAWPRHCPAGARIIGVMLKARSPVPGPSRCRASCAARVRSPAHPAGQAARARSRLTPPRSFPASPAPRPSAPKGLPRRNLHR